MADNQIETTVRSVPVDITGRDIQHLRELIFAELRTVKDQIAHDREVANQREEFHKSTHRMMEDAVSVAKAATDVRLGGMNELREQITSERSAFLPREVYDSMIKEWAKWREIINLAMTEKISRTEYDREHKALEDRVGRLESESANYRGRLWMLGVAVSGVVILVNVLLRLWK